MNSSEKLLLNLSVILLRQRQHWPAGSREDGGWDGNLWETLPHPVGEF